MKRRIIEEVAQTYKNYEGLDEIKNAINISMSVTSNLVDWTTNDYTEIFNGVLIRINELRKEGQESR